MENNTVNMHKKDDMLLGITSKMDTKTIMGD